MWRRDRTWGKGVGSFRILVQLLQQGARGGLLGGAARDAAAGLALAGLDLALDLEGLAMRLALDRGHAVGRQLHLAALQPFLQGSLGILAARAHGRIDVDVLVEPAHQRLGLGEAGIEVDRTDDGLDHVSQDGGLALATRAQFALAQAQQAREGQRGGDARQRVFLDQVGADARELALVLAAQSFVEQARDGQAQHRVTQELEPLVVIGAMAAVGQRPLKQRDGSKTVSQALLQRQQIGIQKLCIPFRPALTSSGRNNA